MPLPPHLTDALGYFESLSQPGFDYNREKVDENGIYVRTKATGEIFVNKSMLLTSFMDQKKIEDLFSPMVVKCSSGEKMMDTQDTGEVVTSMPVTLIMRSLSPAIPPEVFTATRLLKNNTVDGEAVVVDVQMRESETKSILVSGCRVKAISQTQCQVTFVIESICYPEEVRREFSNLLEASFNAVRWLETLKRECERRAIHGFVFSPLVEKDDDRLAIAKMLEGGKKMKDEFFSHIFYEQETDGPVQFRQHEGKNLFSASLSVTINSPCERVFASCIESIEHHDGVQRQFPEGNNNCFFRSVKGGQKKTYIEAYSHPSEALLLYVQGPVSPYDIAGFTMENYQGLPESTIVTFAVIKTFPTDASSEAKELWITNAEEDVQAVMNKIIAAATA